LWIAEKSRGVRRRPGCHLLPFDTEVSTVPTALVTGALDRVPDIVIALKSGGFDILAAGMMSP
jgi:hypothetical protein